jgi:dienelactone hydrolase
MNCRFKKELMGSRLVSSALFVLALIMPMISAAQNPPPESVTVRTFDRFEIAGDYYPGQDGMPGVVLSHMLNRNRSDWRAFANTLQAAGYHVLAIDLRGHGDSKMNGRRTGWRALSKKVFSHAPNDPAAAASWLRKKNGVEKNRIALIGASIGANASVVAASREGANIKTVVLLSCGINYRGVTTEDAVRSYHGPVLIVATDEDKYSAESSRKLAQWAGDATLKIYKGKLHGTNIFRAHDDLGPTILKWLEAKMRN